MKKLSNFYFDSNSAFVENITVKLDNDEWESLNNFLCVWFMVNRVDKLYINFNSQRMTLNNQLQRLSAFDAQVLQKYIRERLGVDGAFSFDFDSCFKEVICRRIFVKSGIPNLEGNS